MATGSALALSLSDVSLRGRGSARVLSVQRQRLLAVFACAFLDAFSVILYWTMVLHVVLVNKNDKKFAFTPRAK